jgi:flavin-dependent dehydrogenase
VPGYLWIFPLPNNEANVGLAMRSDKISERKYNLKQNLQHILHENPAFKDRFAEAELVGDIRGFGLPMGSKKRTLSGERFMLVGDAGHLIDPLTGEGIGNAIFSGVIAADQAIACIKADDYSASFMRAYDKRIQRVMGRELKLGYVFQRMMFYPGLIRFLMKRVYNNRFVMDFLQEVYADSQKNWVRQVKKPMFWWKVVFGGKQTKKADPLS